MTTDPSDVVPGIETPAIETSTIETSAIETSSAGTVLQVEMHGIDATVDADRTGTPRGLIGERP